MGVIEILLRQTKAIGNLIEGRTARDPESSCEDTLYTTVRARIAAVQEAKLRQQFLTSNECQTDPCIEHAGDTFETGSQTCNFV